MAIEAHANSLGYDDYAAIEDGNRYQLIEGELILSPAPNMRHQAILANLFSLLHPFVRRNRLGQTFFAPSDVVLKAEPPGLVVQPDIFFIARDREAIITLANVQGAPDLVIEALSPSTARLDTVRKLRLYGKYGVKEIWFISHEMDQVEVLRLGADGRYGRPELYVPGDTMTSLLLPGFSLAVAELFDEEQDEAGE